MNNNSTIFRVVDFIANALDQGKNVLGNADEFKAFVSELGWDVTSLPASYNALKTDIEQLVNDIKALPPSASVADILGLLTDVSQLYISLKSIVDTPGGIAPVDISTFKNEFGKRFFETFLIYYLSKHYPAAYHILTAFKIFNSEYIPATATRFAYTKRSIDFSKLGDLIGNPLGSIKSFLAWNSDLIFQKLFGFLYETLTGLKVKAGLGLASPELPKIYSSTAKDLVLRSPEMLSAYLLTIKSGGSFYYISLDLIAYGDTNPLENGFIFQLTIPSSYTLSTQITSDIKLEITASSAIGNLMGFLVTPSKITFKYPGQPNTGFPETRLGVTLSYTPAQPFILIGNGDASRLQLKQTSLAIEAIYIQDLELATELDLSGLSLIIDPGDSDNFIGKLFGGTKKEISFPLIIRWSSKTGISFKGSGSFEYAVTTGFKIGPLEFKDVLISLRPPSGDNKVKANIGTSISGVVGPLAFTVRNIGISMQIDLTEGNAGPFGIKVGFKPPTGIGLSIDAPPIVGGGFLNYNEDTYTYTGGLELKFSKISLAAIGILTTRMPDGSDGYSLLIIITAEFTPLQLGMGFTLNGVGGLLGLNRTINTEKLRLGVRDNTLDNILFPQDIVKNANAIISNLGQVFPVKKDRFLIGPMAKIGWGTPTLITIELGIIIELPSPVLLAIVGVLKAILPKSSNRILAIQINFVGIIDFDKKQLSFDASLFDSSILTFSLIGDMALRLYWGDKPNFLMSVGGFHPRFTPPPMNLPDMRRLSIILADSSNLNIKVETYFAITSNSVQFGARVAARAKAWKIEAIGALWFDILFQFSPFHFIADMGVMFEIRKGSSCILSIFISLTVEGPHPWRIQGKGSFKVLFIKVNVSFDKTFGQAQVESIAPAAIEQQVHNAILNKDNWQVTGPDRSHQVVSFRDITASTGSAIVVDPYGGLVFGQKVAPLNIKMARFGTSAISDFNQFNITNVTTGVSPNLTTLPTSATQDFFAPNSFFFLSDDQRLSRDSYEKYTSGVTVGNTENISSSYFVHKKIEYDEIIIDLRQRRKFALYAFTQVELQLHTMDTYVSRSRLSSSSSKTPLGGPKKLNVQEEVYMVADKNTLGTIGAQSFRSFTEASNYVTTLQNDPNYNNYMVVNSFEL